MPDDMPKEYIKAIISLVEEDKKAVLLYVAFDLAVVSLTLSEKLFGEPRSHSSATAFGLFLLLVSGALFFNHYRKLHLSSFELVDQMLTLDTGRARRIPIETWNKYKALYRAAYVIQAVGMCVLVGMYLFK